MKIELLRKRTYWFSYSDDLNMLSGTESADRVELALSHNIFDLFLFLLYKLDEICLLCIFPAKLSIEGHANNRFRALDVLVIDVVCRKMSKGSFQNLALARTQQ